MLIYTLIAISIVPLVAGQGCPDSIRVSSDEKPTAAGVYSITGLTRRGSPVWWDSSSNNFIFRGTNNKWRIASDRYFYADKLTSMAYSNDLNARCPQDLDYKVTLDGKWTYESDLSVTKNRPCSTLRVSGKQAIRYNFDGIYKLVDSTSDWPIWRKRNLSGDRGSYKETRYILPSEDGRRWEIARRGRYGPGENFIDAIAYRSSRSTSRTCPAGLKWRVYEVRNYFARMSDVKVDIV